MEYIDAGFFFQNIPIKFSNIRLIAENFFDGTVIALLKPQQQRAKATENQVSFNINYYLKGRD